MGGNAIKNASKVNGEEARSIYHTVSQLVRDRLKCDVAAGGSTCKKREDQVCGDIDILVEGKMSREYKDLLSDIFFEFKFNDNLIMCGLEWEGKVVQIDLIFVEDLEWGMFAFHSPDFTKGTSQYKGAARNAMISNIFSSKMLGTEEYFTDGGIKTRTRYWMDLREGVKKGIYDWSSKTNPDTRLKNPRKQLLETHYKPKFLLDLLGCTVDDMESTESVYEFAVSDRCNFLDSEDKKRFKIEAQKIYERFN